MGGSRSCAAEVQDQLVSGLRALGANALELPDGFHITGGDLLSGGTVHAHDDHRLAMAFAIAALGARAPVTIEGAEAVSVSRGAARVVGVLVVGADVGPALVVVGCVLVVVVVAWVVVVTSVVVVVASVVVVVASVVVVVPSLISTLALLLPVVGSNWSEWEIDAVFV